MDVASTRPGPAYCLVLHHCGREGSPGCCWATEHLYLLNRYESVPAALVQLLPLPRIQCRHIQHKMMQDFAHQSAPLPYFETGSSSSTTDAVHGRDAQHECQAGHSRLQA